MSHVPLPENNNSVIILPVVASIHPLIYLDKGCYLVADLPCTGTAYLFFPTCRLLHGAAGVL